MVLGMPRRCQGLAGAVQGEVITVPVHCDIDSIADSDACLLNRSRQAYLAITVTVTGVQQWGLAQLHSFYERRYGVTCTNGVDSRPHPVNSVQ